MSDTSAATWRTLGDQSYLFTPQPAITRTAYNGTPGTRPVNIDTTVQYQSMVGFGAAFTDAATSVIWQMPTTPRTALMTDLFSPTSGIGLSFMRLPRGASDFARFEYTYDDNGGTADPSLAAFSIAPDLTYTVPMIQAALALNPDLKIIACPWSPPAWMKTPTALHGGTLDTTYSAVYAQYFVKFIQAYAAQGITIWAVTPQNEPGNPTAAYPSSSMTAAQQVAFIGGYLGPAFTAAGITTKIIAYDHNWDDTSYAQTVFADATAGPYTSGVAWHAYAGSVSAQTTVHNAYPAKDTYFTEITASFPGNFGEDLKWHMREIDLGSANNWARGVIYWNLALNASNGPLNGGYTSGMGLVRVNSDNTVVRYAPYYAKAHMSPVRPGAIRVSADTYGAGIFTTSAYLNPDGGRVLVAMCDAGSAQTFKVIEGGLEFTTTMQPGEVRTFRWFPDTGTTGVSLTVPAATATISSVPPTVAVVLVATAPQGTITRRVWNGTTWVDQSVPGPVPVDWTNIANKPTTFPTTTHTHSPADITGITTYPRTPAALPAGEVMFASTAGARPTARADVTVVWEGNGTIPSQGLPGDWAITTTGTPSGGLRPSSLTIPTTAPSTGFVTRSGLLLKLDGATWRPKGLNLPWSSPCGSEVPGLVPTSAQLSSLFAAMPTKSIFRWWMFKNSGYAAFDAALALARPRGHRFICCLTDAQSGCGEPYGPNVKNDWIGSGFRDQWLTPTVNRYKNEPLVAWWEWANEPSDDGAFQSFCTNVGSYVRNTLGDTHLIGTGTMSSYSSGGSASRRALNGNTYIDLCSMHQYDVGSWGWVGNADLPDANAVGKPLYIGEWAPGNAPAPAAGTDRASVMVSMINQLRNSYPAVVANMYWSGAGIYRGLEIMVQGCPELTAIINTPF